MLKYEPSNYDIQGLSMEIKFIEPVDPLWINLLQNIQHDIYHLPTYLLAEAQKNSAIAEMIIISENNKIFCLPYLLRSCNNIFDEFTICEEIFDIVSPNGYPGFLLNEDAANTPEFLKLALDQLVNVLQTKNICSAFLRLHPIINQGCYAILPTELCHVSGQTVSIDLTLSEAEIWQQTRPEHRTHINRCKRAGFLAKILPLEAYLDEFIEVYNQTMDRVNAKQYFYFNREYFQDLLDLEEKVFLCIVDLDSKVACAGIFTECCEIVQYHLGGTKTEFLKQAPSKLMFDYVRFWAKQRGNKFMHLGGGVGAAQDSLYHFKVGFATDKHPFLTLRLITDKDKYSSLISARAKILQVEPETVLQSNFFPAYRSLN